jgi:hypothetical protein
MKLTTMPPRFDTQGCPDYGRPWHETVMAVMQSHVRWSGMVKDVRRLAP